MFLKDLRDGYDDYALFFHGTYSGIVIGVLLKPAVFERKDFKVADVNCRKLDSNVVLKGRVALQMGSNKLLITELVLKNMLTVLQPAEIVALLSALIFQQRTDSEPTLTSNLANGCEIMNKVHAESERLEQQYQLSTIPSLNFGLVEVVYEWAQAKSFAEIMKMTNVQEGS
ncbi:Helicase SKI2W [Camponotus japonicus]